MSTSYNELELNVIRWAEARKIIPNSTTVTQLLKTMSEVGELADAVIKRDRKKVVDGIGDVMVTLIIVAELEGLTIRQCLEAAYDEIKNRKGTCLPNGLFVKEGDTAHTADELAFPDVERVTRAATETDTSSW